MSDPRPPYDPAGRHDPAVAEAVQRRDQGRRRVSNTTRWAVAAAVAGATVLGAGYAHALPGTSANSSTGTAPSTSSTPSTTPSTPPSTGSSSPDTSGGLQAPSQAPAPAPTTQAPQTQSGAS
jgi:hypothetical protein